MPRDRVVGEGAHRVGGHPRATRRRTQHLCRTWLPKPQPLAHGGCVLQLRHLLLEGTAGCVAALRLLLHCALRVSQPAVSRQLAELESSLGTRLVDRLPGDELQEIADRHGIPLVEDAAEALGSTYKGRPAGSLGDMAAFSFHETKNIISGEGGALNDLGMHACHIPLRLGWKPSRVFAQLQKGYPQRPDGKGGVANCDTWDNALLNTWIKVGGHDVPMRLEMKRLMPGATNTWYIEILGTDGGVRYSTADTKALWLFERGKEQFWKRTDLGFGTPFKTVTGGIFEPGFADVIQQMWAAYLMERAGLLNGRFGCATPDEAVATHEIFAAALRGDEAEALRVIEPLDDTSCCGHVTFLLT